jgi:hypothetical protein
MTMIYTDGTHLVSDRSLDELHLFARLIGLKKEWFQFHPKHSHYDIISQHKKALAFERGAIFVSSRKIVQICRKNAKS